MGGAIKLDRALSWSAGLECGRQRTIVEVVELAADRDAMGEAGDSDAAYSEPVDDVVGRSLALDGCRRGQDHFDNF